MEKCVCAGRLYRYKTNQLAGRKIESHWKETWAVLLPEGHLVWFNDKSCSQEKGRLDVKSHPEALKIGRGAKEVGSPPPAPITHGSDHGYLAVRWKAGKKEKERLSWFYLKSESDTLHWLQAFATILNKAGAYRRLIDTHHQSRPLLRNRRHDEERLERMGLKEPVDGAELGSDWSTLWEELLRSTQDQQHKEKQRRGHTHSQASSVHEREVDLKVSNGHNGQMVVVADVHEDSQ